MKNFFRSLWHSVLEAALIIGATLFTLLLVATLIWAFHYELAFPWGVSWIISGGIWLLSHGVQLRVDLNPEFLAQLGIESSESFFWLSFPLLGLTLITLILARQAGIRIALSRTPEVSLVLTIGFSALFSALIAISARGSGLSISLLASLIFPTLIISLGLLIGFFYINPERIRAWSSRLLNRVDERMKLIWGSAVSGSTAALVGSFGAAAIVLALLIVFSSFAMISSYEVLHSGILGGTILTLIQLLILPNLVVFVLAWLSGPGVELGTGSQISPIATELGPIPQLPIFSVIPVDPGVWGLVWLLLPIAVGVLSGWFRRQKLSKNQLLFSGLEQFFSILITAGLSFVAVLLLGSFASGSIGPGRMADFGVDSLSFALSFAVLIAVGNTIELLIRSQK